MRLGFGVPLTALGTLVAFQTLGYLTTSSLSGRILRVLPIGSVLALSTLAAALALLGFALTTHWPLLRASSPASPATPTAPATSAPASSTGCTPSTGWGPRSGH